MRTVFNLALVNGYDKQMRIRNGNGEFIQNSNLMDLLNHAMSVGKKMNATNEFIDLLAEADVDPENENVKQMLVSRLSKERTNQQPIDPQSPQEPELPSVNPITSGAYWSPETAKQRKLATFTRPSKQKRPSNLTIPSPPPLKIRPITLTPPTSPPSPFRKDIRDALPLLDRMDLPPSSPPSEMPQLKRSKRKHDGEENIFSFEPENKNQRVDDNKSEDEAWMVPPPDDEDDW